MRTRRWVWRQGERGKVTAGDQERLLPDRRLRRRDRRGGPAGGQRPGRARARSCSARRRTILWVDRSTPSAEIPVQPRQPDAIDRLLDRGLAELYPSRAEVERRLRGGEQLRIYIGVDPTSPVIHIGHAVGIRKLRQLQDLGHKIVLLIGDFTGRIGDPTGKDTARVPLTVEQVRENAQSYTRPGRQDPRLRPADQPGRAALQRRVVGPDDPGRHDPRWPPTSPSSR